MVKPDSQMLDPGLLAQAQMESWRFFQRPEDQKMRFSAPVVPGVSRGYVPVNSDTLAFRSSNQNEQIFDVSEKFTVGAHPFCSRNGSEDLSPAFRDPYFEAESSDGHFYAKNMWPNDQPDFKSIWERYIEGMSALSHTLLRVFEMALDMPAISLGDHRKRHFSELRGVHYAGVDRKRAELKELRGISPHRDFSAFTILGSCIDGSTSPGDPYLLIKPAENGRKEESEWIVAPSTNGDLDGYFCVILGEAMERWTNNLWHAPEHYVEADSIPRLTMAYFFNPAYDTTLSESLTVGSHWWQLHDRNSQKEVVPNL